MLPPTRAISATIAETMPGRSPPCTVSTHDVPPAGARGSACSCGTSRTVTVSVPSPVSGASAASISVSTASPAQISIIAK